MKRLAILPALLALAAPARAQQIEHSKAWFQARPAERARTIDACRNDVRLQNGEGSRDICANAEAAENREWARRNRSALALPFREMGTQGWWEANPATRASLRAACARRASYDAPFFPFCRFAG